MRDAQPFVPLEKLKNGVGQSNAQIGLRPGKKFKGAQLVINFFYNHFKICQCKPMC